MNLRDAYAMQPFVNLFFQNREVAALKYLYLHPQRFSKSAEYRNRNLYDLRRVDLISDALPFGRLW